MSKRSPGAWMVFAVFIALQHTAATLGDERPVALISKQAADGTLDGWKFFCEDAAIKCHEVWQLDDGVLICKGTPKGYIYTAKQYADFEMRLQWRWPTDKKPGNGGVLIRAAEPHKIWPKSLEAQLNTGQAGDFWGLGGFTLDGPTERKKTVAHPQFGQLTNIAKAVDAEKPAGEWNQYEIIAKGSLVTLKINGQVVNQATRCETAAGPICLTAEGNEIHFRKIELVEQ